MDKKYVTIDNISLDSITLDDMSIPFLVKFKLTRTSYLLNVLIQFLSKFFEL